MQRTRLAIGVMAILGVFSGSAFAADPVAACQAVKLRATGKKTAAKLQCHAKAVGLGKAVDPACLQRAEDQFEAAFARAENKQPPCTPGDAAAIEAQVDAVVADVVATLEGPGPSTCTKQKLQAAGKKAAAKHICHAAAVGKGPGHGVDGKCLNRAEERFSKAFVNAEARGDCVSGAEDGLLIEEKIDALLVDIRMALAPPISTCDPVTVTSLHGNDPFYGNSRLAKIENGKVPCVHSEDADARRCVFSTQSGSESGAWLESPQGNFARVGQAISLQGVPGGEYVIAAAVSTAATTPCVEPSGLDTAGTPADMELEGACVVEAMGSARNATGQTLENWATLEVCTTSLPHPDQNFTMTMTSFDEVRGVACYTGGGAALNDLNGTERDSNGVYLKGRAHCHVAWTSDGFEVPAAKRPSVSPALHQVIETTPILWRPVTNVTVANP